MRLPFWLPASLVIQLLPWQRRSSLGLSAFANNSSVSRAGKPVGVERVVEASFSRDCKSCRAVDSLGEYVFPEQVKQRRRVSEREVKLVRYQGLLRPISKRHAMQISGCTSIQH